MKHNPRVITLTTDFGRDDSYVAEMKGVILRRNPNVRFIDISHDIPPQDVLHASLLLWRSYRYFPEKTVHLVVVDPTVGTTRRLLIGKTKKYFFVAPDNGVLSPLLFENKDISFYAITPKHFFRSPPSHTFHGRDILAPCAASLSRGIPAHRLGTPLSASSVKQLPSWRLSSRRDRLTGRILSKDHFGNLITNIHEKDYHRFKNQGKGKEVWVKAGKYTIRKLSSTYADGGKAPLALFGSAQLLELAVRDGDASRILSLRPGNAVHLVYGSD